MIPALLAHAHPVWEDFGVLEWAITVLAALFVMWSIWKAVRYTLHPGEEEPDHYKRLIFGPPGAEGAVSSDNEAVGQDPTDR